MVKKKGISPRMKHELLKNYAEIQLKSYKLCLKLFSQILECDPVHCVHLNKPHTNIYSSASLAAVRLKIISAVSTSNPHLIGNNNNDNKKRNQPKFSLM